MSRKIVFESAAFEDFKYWASTDKKMYKKLVSLIVAIERSPFSGLGKPEALKHEWTGYWSRRIDKQHRLVYRVTDKAIEIVACRYHY